MFALPRQHFGQRGKTEGTRARSAQWAVELARDVVVNPAGVTHKNEGASLDLLVVGAYPRGQTPDIGSPGAADHARALPRIAAVPLRASDPVHGNSGPLIERAVGRG